MRCIGLLLAGLIPFIMSAQKNFQPGYVVNLKGDTARGFIDYREWDSNPNRILFRPSDNNSGQRECTVNDISFFEITGSESYCRAIVDISLHPSKLSDISGRDVSSKTDTVFLKIIQVGEEVSLLSYTDRIKERFYIHEKEVQQPKELVMREYYSDGLSLVTEDLYRSQLRTLMYKYNLYSDAMWDRINETRYEGRDLKKIILLINRKDEPNQVRENKSRINWFAGIGLQTDNISFRGEHRFAQNPTRTALTWLPKVSAGVDLFANPNVGKLFFRLEAGFQLNESEITITGSETQTSYKLSGSSVFILPQLNYTLYNTDKLKIPVGVGLGYSWRSYTTNEYREVFFSGEERLRIENYLVLRKGITMLSARASVVISNKIEAALLYRPSTFYTSYSYYSMGGSNMQFQVYYLFRKKK